MLRAEELHEQILARMDLSTEPTDEKLQEIIHEVLEEHSREEFIPLREKAVLGKELFNALRKLDILQELLEDETITEIMINGVENIFIEQNGNIFISEKRFLSKGKLEDIVQQMVAECRCKTKGWLPSECSIAACCIKRTDCDHSKVPKGTDYHEAFASL